MIMQSKEIILGSVDQIPLGQGRCFIINGEEVAVFRGRSGRLFAIENRCPHRRGPLAEGVLGESTIVCPLHGHKFDLKTGEGAEGHDCVRVFNVQEESGEMKLSYCSPEAQRSRL